MEELKYYNVQENKIISHRDLPEKPENYDWHCICCNKPLFIIRMYRFESVDKILKEYALLTKELLIEFLEGLQSIHHIIWTPDKKVIINYILIDEEIIKKVKEIELRLDDNNKPAFYFIMDKTVKLDDLIY